MARVNLVDKASTPAASKPTLDQVHSAFGHVPNMFRAVANSPAALSSMWASFAALSRGRISPKLGEQIAVAVADRNRCTYCLAAHTVLDQKAGATSAEMVAAQHVRSEDPRTAATLAFAAKLVEKRAAIETADVEALRAVGLDDEAIVEILAHVALNLFTNYVNVAFDVPVDFPAVKLSSLC